MTLLLLEALGALVLLCALVWWTMFSGRPRSDWHRDPVPPPAPSRSTVDAVDQLDR